LQQKTGLKERFLYSFFIAVVGLTLFSCKSYKQHIMFKIDDEGDLSYLSSEVTVAEKNYSIQPNDWLELRVYTQ